MLPAALPVRGLRNNRPGAERSRLVSCRRYAPCAGLAPDGRVSGQRGRRRRSRGAGSHGAGGRSRAAAARRRRAGVGSGGCDAAASGRDRAQPGGRAGALVPVAAGDVRRRHRALFPAAGRAVDRWPPSLPAVAALAVHLALGRGGLAALATAALLAVALGVAAGKLRTEAMRAPVLERQIGPVDVYGFVELVEPRPSKGQRLTIRVTALEKHEAHAWPYRVRVRTMSESARARARRRRAPQGHAEPAAGAGAARRLRLRPRGVVPGAGRRGLFALGPRDRRRCWRSRRCRCARSRPWRACGRPSAGASSRRCPARPAPSPTR